MLIAYVDDHAAVREGVSLILESMEGVEKVTQGDDVGALMENTPEGLQHDLVLLDYYIPGSDPLENIKMINAEYSEAKVIVYSSDDSPETARLTLEAGVDGFIVKTTDASMLKTIIQFVISGGTYIPVHILDSQKTVGAKAKALANGLTERQQQVMSLLLTGHSNKTIGRELGIEEVTVKAHVSAAYKILKVRNRAQAISRFKE